MEIREPKFKLGDEEKLMTNNKDWINVNDREPAHKGLYITCDELGIVDLTQYDHGKCGWFTDADSKVTHWMPLPDAPTGDEDNE